MSQQIETDKIGLSGVSLEITSRCNEKCLYCYHPDRGVADRGVSNEATEDILDLVSIIAAYPSIRQITLTGGEPFLRRDVLSIVDHIAAKGLRIGVVSNASLVDKTLAIELARRPISYVQTTFLAPDAAAHDALAGTGSFAARQAGVRNLVAAGVRVGGAFICTRLNYQSTGVTLAMMRELGMKEHLCFMRYCAAGSSLHHRHKLAPSLGEVREALAQAERFAAEQQIEIHNKIPIPPYVIDVRDYPHVVFAACGAATDEGECCVDQWGWVRLCGPNPNRLANIREHSFGDIISSASVRRWKLECAPCCRLCESHTHCRGGCPVVDDDPLRQNCLDLRKLRGGGAMAVPNSFPEASPPTHRLPSAPPRSFREDEMQTTRPKSNR